MKSQNFIGLIGLVAVIASMGYIGRPQASGAASEFQESATVADRADAYVRAPAAKPSMFGVALSAELQDRDCGSLPAGRPDRGYCHGGGATSRNQPPSNDRVRLYFPFEELPAWVYGAWFDVEVVDNKVERIVIATTGIAAQAKVEQALSAKFGKPTSWRSVALRNGYGTTFDGIEAEWQEQDWRVEFRGAVDGTDKGLVIVSTRAGDDAFSARARAGSRERAL